MVSAFQLVADAGCRSGDTLVMPAKTRAQFGYPRPEVGELAPADQACCLPCVCLPRAGIAGSGWRTPW